MGDGELLYFRGCKHGSACTIVLRGANEFMLDEMDRALHDSLCVIKRMVESNALVAGGGAVEAALSIYLEGVATTIATREQLAVAQFAEALLVIPRTLTVNAAHDATDLVAQLRAHHYTSQVRSIPLALVIIASLLLGSLAAVIHYVGVNSHYSLLLSNASQSLNIIICTLNSHPCFIR